MMEEDYIYLSHVKEKDYGPIDIVLIKGKDDVLEKSENKLFKYSELGNFGIRGLNSF